MTAVFKNGRFFTATPDQSVAGGKEEEGEPAFAECMIVRDGIITYIGPADHAEVTATVDSGASIHDLRQRIVLPGFIDAHMHLLLMGQSLTKLDLGACKSLDDIRRTISAFARTRPELPRILCKGWMHSMTSGRALASMLDDLDPRPIFIDSKDLHSTWCNGAALAEMAVQDLPDPSGGVISRDAEGKASGLLSEAAAVTIVWPHLARVAPMEEKLAALRAAFNAYVAAGYTGVVEMAMDENGWSALQHLRQIDGKLPIRVAAHWLITPSLTEAENLAQVDRAIALHSQYNSTTSPDCRIAGIKIISDGVIDVCTAALLHPYSNGHPSATPLWPPSSLSPVIHRADAAGLQCAIHAIGDAAISTAVSVLASHGTPGRRHRIEHLELASRSDAKRLGELGITASIQPVHADPAILRAWPALLGPERCKRAFAYKEFEDGGATLAIGSDAPTAPHAVLPNLYVATTRRSAREPPDAKGEAVVVVNPHFALSLSSAVAAATRGAAYSCFSDSFAGGLECGKMADFVVVDLEWDAERLLEGRVRETWVEGVKVFDVDLYSGP